MLGHKVLSLPCWWEGLLALLVAKAFFVLFSSLLQDAFVELYGPSVRPLFDFSWLSLKTLLSLALVGACITLGAYLGHK